MLRRLKSRARKSFTDSLYFLNFIIVMILTQECLGLIVLSGFLNMSATALASIKTFLICSWTELGTHTAFIIYKAKCENVQKYSKQGLDVSGISMDSQPDLNQKVDSMFTETVYDYNDNSDGMTFLDLGINNAGMGIDDGSGPCG